MVSCGYTLPKPGATFRLIVEYEPQCGTKEGGIAVGSVRETEVLTVEEAAQLLRFAPYTIREKAREGQIPGRKIGGEWRFSRRRLLEWLEEGDRQHTPA
jgi:excisionase family DNA binding protein